MKTSKEAALILCDPKYTQKLQFMNQKEEAVHKTSLLGSLRLKVWTYKVLYYLIYTFAFYRDYKPYFKLFCLCILQGFTNPFQYFENVGELTPKYNRGT